MADAPASAPTSSGSKGSGLTRKVGPLPVWAWALIGFGAYYVYTHYISQSSSGPAAASAQTPGVTVGNITQTLRGGTGAAGTSSGGGGTGTATVPNVVGDNDAVADAKIIGAGLKVHDVNEPKGGVGGRGTNPPLVSSQSPAPGTKVAPGSAVSVTFATKGGTTGKPAKGKPPRKAGTGTNSTTPPTGTAGVPVGTGSNVVNVTTPGQGFQENLQTGGPVSADTGNPVYWEWTHAHRGPQVPGPVLAYAPQTGGAIYGPATDVGPPPEVTQTVAQSASQSANAGATTGGA